jgi:glycosyltransferase involved in cell wall biosynthesis
VGQQGGKLDTGPEPLVTIGIPAYNATSFLEATVRSACAQDYPHVRLIVSVDRSTDGTVDLARRLAAEHGFELIVQPRRLGWIGNSNAVLRRMTSEFGMILPHDDLLSPSYVSRCMAALLANEASVVACSDLECVPDGTIVPQLELRGDRVVRVAKCVKDGFLAVSYRGVLRFDRFRRREVPNAIGGFAADALWMVRMAIAGEIVRVPEVLYRKTFHPTSAHLAWTQMTDRQEERRWLAHTAEIMLLLMRDAPLLLCKRAIWKALRKRARRLGQARLLRRHGAIGGWAARYPMSGSWVEYLRHLFLPAGR